MPCVFKTNTNEMRQNLVIYFIETNGASNPSKTTFAGLGTSFSNFVTAVEALHSGKTLQVFGEVTRNSLNIDVVPNKQTVGSGGKTVNNNYTGTMTAEHIALDSANWDGMDTIRMTGVTFYIFDPDRLKSTDVSDFLSHIVYDVNFEALPKVIDGKRRATLDITKIVAEPSEFHSYCNMTRD